LFRSDVNGNLTMGNTGSRGNLNGEANHRDIEAPRLRRGEFGRGSNW